MSTFKTFTIILASMILVGSCRQSNKSQKDSSCMARIFKIDDSLGSIRNHACEKLSLSITISNYSASLSSLDFKHCPESFKNAFKDHEIAWRNMIQVTDNHLDLRGEMHDLFDQIETSADSLEFKKRLKDIWDTWAVIEDLSKSAP